MTAKCILCSLDNDCSIRVYQSLVAIFQKYFLALTLMLSVPHYAHWHNWLVPTICKYTYSFHSASRKQLALLYSSHLLPFIIIIVTELVCLTIIFRIAKTFRGIQFLRILRFLLNLKNFFLDTFSNQELI